MLIQLGAETYTYMSMLGGLTVLLVMLTIIGIRISILTCLVKYPKAHIRPDIEQLCSTLHCLPFEIGQFCAALCWF